VSSQDEHRGPAEAAGAARPPDAQDPGTPPEPTPEELAAAFAEQLARTPVRDLLLQTMAAFTDMAGIRLGFGPGREGARDLAQARQAIEALRALLDVAERELGAAQARPFREPLAALQMAYARAVEETSQGGRAAPAETPADEPSAAPGSRPADDPASRLWVPPGTRRPGSS
jgi:Domain of unknown function (DUF1844)